MISVNLALRASCCPSITLVFTNRFPLRSQILHRFGRGEVGAGFQHKMARFYKVMIGQLVMVVRVDLFCKSESASVTIFVFVFVFEVGIKVRGRLFRNMDFPNYIYVCMYT